MPLVIPDDVLRQAHLTEQEARVEIACRWFDAGKLELWPAAKFAGLTRAQMEDELRARKIAIYRYTEGDLGQDLAGIEHLERVGKAGK